MRDDMVSMVCQVNLQMHVSGVPDNVVPSCTISERRRVVGVAVPKASVLAKVCQTPIATLLETYEWCMMSSW